LPRLFVDAAIERGDLLVGRLVDRLFLGIAAEERSNEGKEADCYLLCPVTVA
jgi:hypothetical protein